MALNQFGSGGNVWKCDKHYTLREMTRRKVLKFNTTGIDHHLTLKPQSNGVLKYLNAYSGILKQFSS